MSPVKWNFLPLSHWLSDVWLPPPFPKEFHRFFLFPSTFLSVQLLLLSPPGLPPASDFWVPDTLTVTLEDHILSSVKAIFWPCVCVYVSETDHIRAYCVPTEVNIHLYLWTHVFPTHDENHQHWGGFGIIMLCPFHEFSNRDLFHVNTTNVYKIQHSNSVYTQDVPIQRHDQKSGPVIVTRLYGHADTFGPDPRFKVQKPRNSPVRTEALSCDRSTTCRFHSNRCNVDVLYSITHHKTPQKYTTVAFLLLVLLVSIFVSVFVSTSSAVYFTQPQKRQSLTLDFIHPILKLLSKLFSSHHWQKANQTSLIFIFLRCDYWRKL